VDTEPGIACTPPRARDRCSTPEIGRPVQLGDLPRHAVGRWRCRLQLRGRVDVTCRGPPGPACVANPLRVDPHGLTGCATPRPRRRLSLVSPAAATPMAMAGALPVHPRDQNSIVNTHWRSVFLCVFLCFSSLTVLQTFISQFICNYFAEFNYRQLRVTRYKLPILIHHTKKTDFKTY